MYDKTFIYPNFLLNIFFNLTNIIKKYANNIKNKIIYLLTKVFQNEKIIIK